VREVSVDRPELGDRFPRDACWQANPRWRVSLNATQAGHWAASRFLV
jgi:hypothetical protein